LTRGEIFLKPTFSIGVDLVAQETGTQKLVKMAQLYPEPACPE
jgi:hypothetical protein